MAEWPFASLRMSGYGLVLAEALSAGPGVSGGRDRAALTPEPARDAVEATR